MSYEWHHDFMAAGQKVAAALEGWRPGFTDKELESFDGDLTKHDGLREGLEEIVKEAILALVVHYGEETTRRIVEQAISGPLAVSPLAFSVFGLAKIELACRQLEIRAGEYCEVDGALAILREIQSFAQGKSEEGFRLIEEFRVFVNERSKGK